MDYKAIATWALLGGTGMSSKCIAQHLMGFEADGSYPHDGGDFDRCEALLNAVPEFRERLHEMASVNRYWAALVPRWEEIRAAKDKYRIIQSIVRPAEDQDKNHVKLGDGVSMRFGPIR